MILYISGASAEMQTLAWFWYKRLLKCWRLAGFLIIICWVFISQELPEEDDLNIYLSASANSSRICIRLNTFLQIVCSLQAKRDVRAADEIHILAVLSVFRQTIEFEKGERMHFGRRTWGRSSLSAGWRHGATRIGGGERCEMCDSRRTWGWADCLPG